MKIRVLMVFCSSEDAGKVASSLDKASLFAEKVTGTPCDIKWRVLEPIEETSREFMQLYA